MTNRAPAVPLEPQHEHQARRRDLALVPAPLQAPPPPPGLPRLRLLAPPASEPPYDDDVEPAPVLRLVPRLPARPPAPEPALPTDPRQPSVRPFAVALVRRLVEVRGGARPVLQLQRDTTPGLYADLERGLRGRPHATGPRPGSRDIRSVHVQERPDGVAEVCATVSRGEGRMGALALRLENVAGRWLCTQVQGL